MYLCSLLPLAVVAGGVAGTRAIDRYGNTFFSTGREVERLLAVHAKSLQTRRFSELAQLYAGDFTGHPVPVSSLFSSQHQAPAPVRLEYTPASKHDVLSGWEAWAGLFSALDTVTMHLDRVESWEADSSCRATVHFEAAGTPRGYSSVSIDRGYLRMEFRLHDGALQITRSEFLQMERLSGADPQFSEIGKAAGIAFRNQYYPAFLNQPLRFGMIRYGPAGITAADYDNDGFADLFIPDGVRSRLLRNDGVSRFEDVTDTAGLAGLDGVSVALFADIDNDGDKDLFVSRTFHPNQLFRNNGDGTFTDITSRTGIGADCCTTVAAFADYDNDGDLDLYVGRYLDPRTALPTTFYARNGEPNQLYRNNGNSTFTNVTAQAGVGEIGLCLGVVFGDYDNDGDADLYVVNDFGRNTLYRNNGNGTFTDVTVAANALAYGAGMSASFVDYDNDGRLDIYVTNIRSESAWFAEAPTVMRYVMNSWRQGVWRTDMPLYLEIWRQSGSDFVKVFQQMASGNTLLRNKGDGTFEDVTTRSNTNPHGWYWGASFADFDNDGFQDAYVADGWVYNQPDTEIELDFLNNVVSRQDEYKTGKFFDPAHFGQSSWHGWERNRFLRNRGDGTFAEVGRITGTDLLTNSRGVAVADFWNRGAIDIAVAASDDSHALLRNDMRNRGNWLQVELTGTRSNRDGAGARVTVRAGGVTQMREVVIGDGYGSQNSLRQHFGLRATATVEELTVRWPATGVVQRFLNVPANQAIRVTESSHELTTVTTTRGKS